MRGEVEIEMCGALDGGGCDRPAKKAGICYGHHQQKMEGKPFTPLLEQHASRGEGKLSSLDLLCAAARQYADADVSNDAAYHLALRNLVAAARMRILRPLTGLRLPGFVEKREVAKGLVQVTFKERRK